GSGQSISAFTNNPKYLSIFFKILPSVFSESKWLLEFDYYTSTFFRTIPSQFCMADYSPEINPLSWLDKYLKSIEDFPPVFSQRIIENVEGCVDTSLLTNYASIKQSTKSKK